MATINRWPSLAFLDGRYVNVTGDRMTGDLHVDLVSVTAFKVDDDTGGTTLDTFVVDTSTPQVTVGGGATLVCGSVISGVHTINVSSTTALKVEDTGTVANVLVVDTVAGTISSGGTPTDDKLTLIYSPTNDTAAYGINLLYTPIVTSTGSYAYRGYNFVSNPRISGGTTNTSESLGTFVSNLGATGFDGTLNIMYGSEVKYGLTTGATGTINTCYGIRMLPHIKAGTIGTLYNIFIDGEETGGTLTNTYYSIKDLSTGHWWAAVDDKKIIVGAGADGEIYVNSDHLNIKNVTQDMDIILGIDDGGTPKTITWDADVDRLKHSAGTFNFDNDNLTTSGNLTVGSSVLSSGSGVLTLGGTGGSNNYTLTLDFESETNIVAITAPDCDVIRWYDVFYCEKSILMRGSSQISFNAGAQNEIQFIGVGSGNFYHKTADKDIIIYTKSGEIWFGNDNAVSWPIKMTSTDLLIALDDSKLLLGTGQDASFGFDGDSVNLIANVVTATDDFEITAGTTKTSSGRVHKTNRLTGNTTLDETYHEVLCDTDGGAFTVTLPAGVNGTNYRITNTGSSSNTLTVAPNGAELIKGVNANQTIGDKETMILTYETTEGWF